MFTSMASSTSKREGYLIRYVFLFGVCVCLCVCMHTIYMSSPIHVGIFSGFILCRCRTFFLRYHECLCTKALSCTESTVWL